MQTFYNGFPGWGWMGWGGTATTEAIPQRVGTLTVDLFDGRVMSEVTAAFHEAREACLGNLQGLFDNAAEIGRLRGIRDIAARITDVTHVPALLRDTVKAVQASRRGTSICVPSCCRAGSCRWCRAA